VLLATDLLDQEDRELCLAAVPWRDDVRELAVVLIGTLRNRAVDLIDIAVGTHHARAALVALHEGVDALVQAALELAESSACEHYFADRDLPEPLTADEPFPAEHVHRMRARLARIPVEHAIVRVASAGNHLVNAHLRLAWEANAATRDELRLCRFDPQSTQGRQWAVVANLRHGLEDVRKRPLAVFPAFALNAAFDKYAADPAVVATTDLRDRIVHRDRPSFRESPAFGRESLWAGDFSVSFPAFDADVDDDAPTIAERRDQTSAAALAALRYAEACWDLMVRWLFTVDVSVMREPGQVRVTTNFRPGQRGPRLPREQRDPSPFLVASG
jgi:hypothetical protein